MPTIHASYTPPNRNTTPELQAAFEEVVNKEFRKGRWLGPYSKETIEKVLGPFQTSPITMVPKPGKPGKFRLIQNFSHPHKPIHLPSGHYISSINSNLDSTMYPCLWGTFRNTCRLIWTLPPGSQGAIRDLSEAYRTIPLHPSQWPGTVVRIDDLNFAIDTRNAFGLATSAGTFGHVADAGADICRAHGIGPVSKWVDDHFWLRIQRQWLPKYNETRNRLRNRVAEAGGAHHIKGRIVYFGDWLPDGQPEEFDDDFRFPIIDYSGYSPRSAEDSLYTYAICDIDRISNKLGYIWEHEKDILFCFDPIFFGFQWHLLTLKVSVPNNKRDKYLDSIQEWERKNTHNEAETDSLYGKLMHISLILTRGRAYLTEIERMLAGLRQAPPFSNHHPPKGLADDLQWWKTQLSSPISRDIPGPAEIFDPQAYSDASGGYGIGIVICGHWRAYRLLPGWKGTGERDITWAEAVGFEILVRIISREESSSGKQIKVCHYHTYCKYSHPNYPSHYQVYGDNQGVVEGWWNGRSRNRATNTVFRRIHQVLGEKGFTVHTRYIPSKHNPADDPSRGIYGPQHLLLPKIPIPKELQPFIIDYDAPLTNQERERELGKGSRQQVPKIRRDDIDIRLAHQRRREQEAEELNTIANSW
jgi:hypothetical protein